MKVNRREFMRKVGAGSIALASMPALLDMLKQPALAQAERGYMFLAVSATAAPAPPAPRHFIAMGGVGTFDPSKGPASPVTGGGSFFHWTAVATPPSPLVGSGTWKARLLTSYREIGTYGGAASGIADFVIDIQRIRPSPASFRGAVLRVVCDLGPGGLVTGEIEGYTLSIPGTEFSAGGTPGPFRQLSPNVGLTVFRTPEVLG